MVRRPIFNSTPRGRIAKQFAGELFAQLRNPKKPRQLSINLWPLQDAFAQAAKKAGVTRSKFATQMLTLLFKNLSDKGTHKDFVNHVLSGVRKKRSLRAARERGSRDHTNATQYFLYDVRIPERLLESLSKLAALEGTSMSAIFITLLDAVLPHFEVIHSSATGKEAKTKGQSN